jgi:hypothetical protein
MEEEEGGRERERGGAARVRFLGAPPPYIG